MCHYSVHENWRERRVSNFFTAMQGDVAQRYRVIKDKRAYIYEIFLSIRFHKIVVELKNRLLVRLLIMIGSMIQKLFGIFKHPSIRIRIN